VTASVLASFAHCSQSRRRAKPGGVTGSDRKGLIWQENPWRGALTQAGMGEGQGIYSDTGAYLDGFS
jgi:hypothetical protein